MLRAPRWTPLRTGLVILLPSLLLALSGCGGSGDDDGAEKPSKATVACRAQWKDLGSELEGRVSATNPSALPQRWNNIAASVDYYATSASAGDCGKTMDQQQESIRALTAFAPKLEPYDMELRLEKVQADAQRYASTPQPSASASPKASPKSGTDKKKNGDKADKPQRATPAPTPAAVGLALKTLAQQAPVATQQQGPGWEQAGVTELADAAAVTKTVKDLAFLSSESQAYRACSAALLVITKAMASTR